MQNAKTTCNLKLWLANTYIPSRSRPQTGGYPACFAPHTEKSSLKNVTVCSALSSIQSPLCFHSHNMDQLPHFPTRWCTSTFWYVQQKAVAIQFPDHRITNGRLIPCPMSRDGLRGRKAGQLSRVPACKGH